MTDGFESSVAQRMPSTKAQAPREPKPLREVPTEPEPEEMAAEPGPPAPEAEAAAQALRQQLRERPVRLPDAVARQQGALEGGDVLRIVGQLKGQLLALETTKRALERELSTARRQVEPLAADNKALREQLEVARAAQAEVERLREENALLEEEASDVLGRLEQFRRQNEEQRTRLDTLGQEQQAAAEELARLRSADTEGEFLRIKAEFLEKEKTSLAAENAQLGRECEELKDERDALGREVGALKKALKEIRESLLLVRDSARSDYYDLT
jgi:chromosome segregation ATPase